MEWKHADSLVKKNVPGAVFSKEGHADTVLWHERIHPCWFVKFLGKTMHPLPMPEIKFTFFYWMTQVYYNQQGGSFTHMYAHTHTHTHTQIYIYMYKT